MRNLALILLGLIIGIGSLRGQTKPIDLNFDIEKYESQTLTLNGNSFKVRAYENIIYVKNPVDTSNQKMNIYIPEEYFNGKSIHGYSAQTAPIFFPNKVGGYMPSFPASTKNNSFGPPPINGAAPAGMPPMGFGGPKQNTVLVALSRGYIVASAGTRGRTSKDGNGQYTGKAPADIVDLKAAICYLKFNDDRMPGDARKIISNGTSAGGAMSTLLGATGNNADYKPFLKALGAADAQDDIFAVSAYCPIINLENADMAYEWQFSGIYSYKRFGPMQNNAQKPSELTPEQIAVSEELKKMFPAYINGLNLKDKNGKKLILDKNGNGSFKDWVKSFVVASAQKALDSGTDMTKYSFLSIQKGKITQLDYDAYIKYMERQKTPPAFDALDLSSPETNLFGTSTINNQHFTKFSAEHSKSSSTLADASVVKMMNPMSYLGQANTDIAKHWRIRHGTKDKDTGLAISVIFSTTLQNQGVDINFELPWDRPHSGDYDLNELFAWVDQICK